MTSDACDGSWHVGGRKLQRLIHFFPSFDNQRRRTTVPVKQDMNAVAWRCGPLHVVPSPAVLRFLQIQAECLPFLAAHASQNRPTSTQQHCWTQTRQRHHSAVKESSSVRDRPYNIIRRCATSSVNLCHAKPHLLTSSPSQQSQRSLVPGGQWRCLSTTSHMQKWARPWQRVRQKPASPLQPNDLPPASSFLDGDTSLGRLSKPTNELSLRCTEFDENGNVTLVNGAFKKSELIAKVPTYLLHFTGTPYLADTIHSMVSFHAI